MPEILLKEALNLYYDLQSTVDIQLLDFRYQLQFPLLPLYQKYQYVMT